MSPHLIELVGIAGATLTTLCWLPQAMRLIRTRETNAISLIGYSVFVVGIVCWLIYGVAIMNWPLIGANAVTLVLATTILGLKIRYG